MPQTTWEQPTLEYPDPIRAGKTCTRCAVCKPYSDFSRRKAKADGYRSQCKACDAADRKANAAQITTTRQAWRAKPENRERERETERARYARNAPSERERKLAWMKANPEKWGDIRRRTRLKNRDTQNARTKRWRIENPDHVRVYNKEYREANLDQRQESIREWRLANPDKVRIHNRRRYASRRQAPQIPFTAEQLAARLSMFPGCWVCGGPKEAVDHVKPLNKRGWHALMNLRPICRRDNSIKKDRWWGPAETIRRMRLPPSVPLTT